MKLVLEVSPAEDAVIQLLAAYGWKAPDNVEVQVLIDTVSSPAPPMQPKDGGVGFVQTPVNTPVDAGAAIGAAAGVVKAAKGGFDVVFQWLIPEEGEYTNDPNDPGGPTM